MFDDCRGDYLAIIFFFVAEELQAFIIVKATFVNILKGSLKLQMRQKCKKYIIPSEIEQPAVGHLENYYKHFISRNIKPLNLTEGP